MNQDSKDKRKPNSTAEDDWLGDDSETPSDEEQESGSRCGERLARERRRNLIIVASVAL